MPTGLRANDLRDVLTLLAERNPASLTVASFIPDLENGQRIVEVAVDCIIAFLRRKDGI